MDTAFLELIAFIKTNGIGITIAWGALWLSRRGDWIWRREFDSAINAQKELTNLWKLRAEKNELLLYRVLKLAEPSAASIDGAAP